MSGDLFRSVLAFLPFIGPASLTLWLARLIDGASHVSCTIPLPSGALSNTKYFGTGIRVEEEVYVHFLGGFVNRRSPVQSWPPAPIFSTVYTVFMISYFGRVPVLFRFFPKPLLRGPDPFLANIGIPEHHLDIVPPARLHQGPHSVLSGEPLKEPGRPGMAYPKTNSPVNRGSEGTGVTDGEYPNLVYTPV